MNNIIRSAIGADYAVEHIDPGIRMGHNPVMLSGAKHLVAQRNRPFAEFTLSGSEGLRVTVEGRFQHPDYFVKIHYRAHRRFIGLRWMIPYQVERSVGADLSRTPPIHRPLLIILTPG